MAKKLNLDAKQSLHSGKPSHRREALPQISGSHSHKGEALLQVSGSHSHRREALSPLCGSHSHRREALPMVGGTQSRLIGFNLVIGGDNFPISPDQLSS